MQISAESENSMTTVMQVTRKMKADSSKMAALPLEIRNLILGNIKTELLAHKEEIFAANRIDLDAAETNHIADSVRKRLKFNEGKLKDVVNGIDQLITLKDPIGQIQLQRELDEGLRLVRVSCPIGVIGIIFEARPDAMVQISSLCIKSGNCAVLKGGKETINTNRVLFRIISETAVASGAPEGCLFQVEGHSEISDLLACNKYVDLLIPRGSNAFVRYIMDNTKIPVMGHADGICHTYIDKDADLAKACSVLLDAKTQYTAACNATETLLLDRSIAGDALPVLAQVLEKGHVRLRGTKEVCEMLSMEKDRSSSARTNRIQDAETNEPNSCDIMDDDDFATEYLDLILSVKLVNGVDEAISHINTYGSHHTDCIITENAETAERFMQLVDSAGVYQNCSTRFADGFRYGFGAEVGISTGKIHARGPVGLEGLTTYKYKLYGNGHIVGDYAEGRKEFHFRDL